jgi:hypothetical protein
MTQTYSLANAPDRAAKAGVAAAHQYEQTLFALSRRTERAARDHGLRMRELWTDAAAVWRGFAASQAKGQLAEEARAYAGDAAQRVFGSAKRRAVNAGTGQGPQTRLERIGVPSRTS